MFFISDFINMFLVKYKEPSVIPPMPCNDYLDVKHYNCTSQTTFYPKQVWWNRAVGKRAHLMIIFLISHWNHMLWPLIWTVSSRRFRWGSQHMFLCRINKKLSFIITKYSHLSRAHFSSKQYVVTPHLNRLIETVQIRGHNMFFLCRVNKNYP